MHQRKMIEENNNNVVGAKHKKCNPCRNNNVCIENNEGTVNGYTTVLNCWFVVLPACAALLCYANGFYGDFVHDDVFAIKNNPDVLGVNSFSAMFVNDFWGKPMTSNTSHKSFRPLTILSFRLNYFTTGLQPFYFHATNIILHILVTSLFSVMCKHVFYVSSKVSAMAGLLFAVHPVHTEAVTGLVGRAEVLAAVFFLMSILAYHRSIQDTTTELTSVASKASFAASLVLASAAMLSKETGVTALGVCLILDGVTMCSRYNISKQSDISKEELRHFLYRCASVVMFTIFLLWVRAWVMNFTLPHFSYHDNPASFQASLITRMLSYGYIWSQNIWLLLSPSRLCYDWQNYSIPLVTSVSDVRNVATLTTFMVIAAICYKVVLKFASAVKPSTRSVDPMCVSLVLMLVPFLPASNLLFTVGFVLAERILYLPSLGFCLLVAIGVERLYQRAPHYPHVITAFYSALIVVHGCRTWQQNKVWDSREALFRSGVEVMPHNTKVHYNYANYLKDAGRTDEAVVHYRQTLRLDDKYASAYNNLGTVLTDRAEAERYFKRTLELVPLHQSAHINLGTALCKRGEITSGLALLYKAVEIDETNTDALTSLASGLIVNRNYSAAESYVREALRLRPNMQEAHVVMGKLKEQLGHHKESAASFRRAHDLDPSKPLPLVQAAYNYKRLGDVGLAEHLLKEALNIRRDVTALEQLALLYYQSGRTSESLHVYEEISQMAHNTTDLILRYGKVLATSGNYRQAVHVLQELVSKNPDSPDVLHVTGQVMAATGMHSTAISYFNRSVAVLNEINTSNVDVVDVIFDRACSYLEERQYDTALQDFHTVLLQRPNDVLSNSHVGTIYHLQGRLHQAEFHYEEALRVDPNKSIIQDNLKKLKRMLVSEMDPNR